MGGQKPASGPGLGRQVAAARRALERLDHAIAEAVPRLSEDEREELSQAVGDLEVLVDELQAVRARGRDAALEAVLERRRYRELFDLAPDGYITLDETGLIQQANRAASEMLATPQRWLHGKPFVVFLDMPDARSLHGRLRSALAEGGLHEWEARLSPRQGETFPVLVRCSAGSGEPAPLLRLLLHDLRPERRAEAERRAALEDHSEQVEELERRKSTFLRLASHELRSPLAVIRGYVALLRDGSLGSLPGLAAEVLPTLDLKVAEMSRMVDELLDAARLEEGRVDLSTEPVDLTEVAAAVVESARPLVSERHRLALRPGGSVVVRGDRRRIGTIVANLVDNAVKYSPEGGHVEVAVSRAAGQGVIEVRDHGIGMSAEQQKSIFQPFGRVVTSETSHISGTGLGLFLCRELARLQKGELEIKSGSGSGTTARLLLPLDSLQTRSAELA